MYFKPHHVKPDPEHGTALLPRRKRAVFLGFSDKNSAWLAGVFEEGSLKTYETRSATFLEHILVKDITQLQLPDPPLIAKLLDDVDAGSGESSVAGVEKSAAGTLIRYLKQGWQSVQWDDPKYSSEHDGTRTVDDHERHGIDRSYPELDIDPDSHIDDIGQQGRVSAQDQSGKNKNDDVSIGPSTNQKTKIGTTKNRRKRRNTVKSREEQQEEIVALMAQVRKQEEEQYSHLRT